MALFTLGSLRSVECDGGVGGTPRRDTLQAAANVFDDATHTSALTPGRIAEILERPATLDAPLGTGRPRYPASHLKPVEMLKDLDPSRPSASHTTSPTYTADVVAELRERVTAIEVQLAEERTFCHGKQPLRVDTDRELITPVSRFGYGAARRAHAEHRFRSPLDARKGDRHADFESLREVLCGLRDQVNAIEARAIAAEVANVAAMKELLRGSLAEARAEWEAAMAQAWAEWEPDIIKVVDRHVLPQLEAERVRGCERAYELGRELAAEFERDLAARAVAQARLEAKAEVQALFDDTRRQREGCSQCVLEFVEKHNLASHPGIENRPEAAASPAFSGCIDGR